MTTTDNTNKPTWIVEQIEQDRKHYKETVELRDKAVRLLKNEDFIAVIKEGYMEAELAAIAHVLASNSTPNLVDKATRDVHSIGALRLYLNRIVLEGTQADQELLKSDEELSLHYEGMLAEMNMQ